MDNRDQEYILLEYTQGLCHECLKQIPGKIVIKDQHVKLLKTCPEHGSFESLLEEDSDYYLKRNDYLKPGTKSTIQTKVEKGCPYDCGLCPEHHQHTCIGLIEITNNCDMSCPVCYAESSKNNQHLSLDAIEKMMDFIQDCEDNQAEILQISGGEPTSHPEILEIIALAKKKRFSYVMLNTNGKRLAEDENFAKALMSLRGDFELYLQFDGLKPSTYKQLRGSSDYLKIKYKALEHIKKYKLPTTLVCTLEQGINEHEIADIVNFGMETDYIRGINFQPVAYFGRHEGGDANNRITMTGIMARLEEQSSGLFGRDIFVPLPCNVDKIAVSYFYKSKKGFIPLTKHANIKSYLPYVRNTLDFKMEDFIENDQFKIGFCDCGDLIKDLKKMIPKGFLFKSKEDKMKYVDDHTFRITISSFIDPYNFDIRSQQRECVHIVTPSLKRYPFSAYNMIHRS